MPNRTVTIKEITRLVGVQIGKRNVHADARLLEELGAESADIANLVTAVEDKYQIVIRESEIAGIRTPSDLFQLVRKHL